MDMGDLTTGEAEAWRAGWRAAQTRALELARAYLIGRPPAIDAFADQISRMQPPSAITNPPGRALEGKP